MINFLFLRFIIFVLFVIQTSLVEIRSRLNKAKLVFRYFSKLYEIRAWVLLLNFTPLPKCLPTRPNKRTYLDTSFKPSHH